MLARKLLKLLILIPFSLTLSTALAQDNSDGANDERILEEILVTATRRGDANIMEMPISITALSGAEIERYAVRDLNDIAVSVPGLSAGTVSAFKSAQFAMRGVSETTIILYKESPVGVTPGISAPATATSAAVFAGAMDGVLRAYDPNSGQIIWQFDTARKFQALGGNTALGGTIGGGSGPVIRDGMIYQTSGYGMYFHMPGNALLAFGPATQP